VAYAQCTSVGASPECDAALDTIRIPIDAVPLENNRTRAISYLIGELVGTGLVIAFVVWLIASSLARRRARHFPNSGPCSQKTNWMPASNVSDAL
jgi:hypothetical protein